MTKCLLFYDLIFIHFYPYFTLMQFTNLNILTITIFLTFILGFAFISYKSYLKQIDFNKDFPLLSSNSFFYIKYLILLLSFFIILFSIFWPKFWISENQSQTKWIDVTFVLDVSKSMNVADIEDNNYKYTRLDIAKKAISDFVVKNKQNRYSLIIFAWEAISTIPLTTDYDVFLTFLDNVDYRNLTKQWSNFEAALRLWEERFSYSEWNSKALIFISDGWDDDYKIDANSIKQITKKENWVNYFIIWVWTDKWWKIITWKDAFWRLSYQTYNWQYVISKLNEKNLKEIKDITWWQYIKVNNVWDLSKLDNYLDNIEKKVINTNPNSSLKDFSRNLTFMSFILFMIFILLYIFENKFYKLIKKDE